MNVIIWRNIPSHHQSQFFDALNKICIKFAVHYYGKVLSNRSEMVAFSIKKYSDEPCILCSIKTIAVVPIPRFIWAEKPVGFGKHLVHDMVDSNLNEPGLSLASGLPSEATFNLSYLGIFIFPVFFGVLITIAF